MCLTSLNICDKRLMMYVQQRKIQKGWLKWNVDGLWNLLSEQRLRQNSH